jgi:hypothetical protein
MKAYLPAKFLQVALHQRGGNPARLDRLFRLFGYLNLEPVMGIHITEIKDPGLLLLPTRQLKYPFDGDEISCILEFVSQGNPLFHLSNHYPLTIQDSILGQEFGYRFHGVIRGSNPARDFDVYPLSGSNQLFDPSNSNMHFTIRNSSMLATECEKFAPIADFSRSEITSGQNNAAFGIARSRDHRAGAIVALADSGLLGEPMPSNPGPGLEAGNNIDLVGSILLWLLEQTA